MFDAAHPGDGSFDAHAEAGVRDAAVAAEVEVPFEGFLRQVVLDDLLFEKFYRGRAFTAADDLAVAFGSEQIGSEGEFGPSGVAFEVECFDDGGEVMNEDR